MFETILSLFNLVGAINAKKIVCLFYTSNDLPSAANTVLGNTLRASSSRMFSSS